MNYDKYIGKRVIITNDWIFYGKVGTLINVVPTQWFDGKGDKIAHVQIEDYHCLVVPVTEIVLLKEEN